MPTTTFMERAQKTTFKPMISKPIVPVEIKIVGILKRMDNSGGRSSLKEILSDSVSLPDMIAIFIGVLELIKVRKILIDESDDTSDLPDGNLHGESTRFIINTDESKVEKIESENYQ